MRILYVDIDTLRPDHLGCYGYHRPTSPAIDALASEGTTFRNVYASDVPCLPSRTALITGMFGIRNGVANHGGLAADLRPWGAGRGFFSKLAINSFASVLMSAGYHTTSISSFPLRHSAPWWTSGFMESMNLVRGFGRERADMVMPGVLDWIERRGREDSWFLHVHLWDPHTPYNTPESFGNPFEGDPIPSWHTESVRLANWDLPGPHSAQEPWGFRPDEWGELPPRQPWDLATEADVKQMFDGYDVGVRYADQAVSDLCTALKELGVLEDTAIWIGSDHGEAFGELGVYADHMAADEATSHIPTILRWPGIEKSTQAALLYHLDVATTVADLAGAHLPTHWDGQSFRPALEAGTAIKGRDQLVISQGAWTCQRGVRFGDWLYLRTFHDGYHAAWNEEMLFDVATDPHEQENRFDHEPTLVEKARSILGSWTDEQLARSLGTTDPMDVILGEGGPFHVRDHLPSYLSRLEETGRGHWAEVLRQRYPDVAIARPSVATQLRDTQVGRSS